ncbi:MAG: ATP-binding protein [Candidatus Bathyarchaeia archaeon]|nr:ATP-binding protein [Candidatus Bathyarchaeia archaeon]MDI6903877.1 ATP-binding protein [Candidatus Bathyarchaeia archaeon]
MVTPSLSDQNSWWRDKHLIESDPLIATWESSSFKWRPRIVETFQWDVNVIYSLRGPRQVGKTTLVKLKVRELLRGGVDGRRIFYWTCDQVESSEKLTAIISEYVEWARRFSKDRLFLFLDEVSAVKDWQRSIKYLYDTGKLRNCLVVVTGSHSIDLVKATESLAGRRGEVDKLGENLPDKILLGAKFPEYVETRNLEILRVLRRLNLLSKRSRLQLLGDLAKGEIQKSIHELRPYMKDLHGLFEDFLITGGVPRATHSYISQGTIPDIVYSDYVNLIIRDIARWGGNEVYLRQIMQRIIETLSSQVSWNALKDETEISTHDTARWYVDILKNSFVVSYIHQLDKDKGVPYYRKAKKICFTDPFIFHALKWWALGERHPFDGSMEFLGIPEKKSRLVESVVCDHMIRLLFDLEPSPQFDYTTKLFYWESSKKREVDFVAKLENAFLPIELKYKPVIHRNDVYGIIDFMKGGKSHKGIILTDDALVEGRNYLGIPVSIFLLVV